MKRNSKILIALGIASTLLCASESNAQLFGGRVLTGSRCQGACFGGNCARSYSYAPTFGGYVYGSACATGACYAQTVQPCAPCAADIQKISDEFDKAVEEIQACEPVRACEPVAACEAVKSCTCENCKCAPCQCGSQETYEQISACENVQTVPHIDCPTGSCPVPTAIRTPVRKVAGSVVATGYLATVNAARAAIGLPALILDATLEAGAQRQANAMARYGALFHSGGVAENCAESSSAQGAVNQWLGSPGHYANMMNPRYTRAGLAAGRDSRGRVFWCLQLR